MITFAASGVQALAWAAGGALVAGAIVAAAVAVLRHPLRRVPENAMGFVVGIMLLSFGTYWSGEGLNIEWPGADLALVYLAAGYLAVAFALVAARRTPVSA